MSLSRSVVLKAIEGIDLMSDPELQVTDGRPTEEHREAIRAVE
jgi:hypothetical protein